MTIRTLLICAALILGSANASGTRRLRRTAAEKEDNKAVINAKYLDLTSEVDERTMQRVHLRVMENTDDKKRVLLKNRKSQDRFFRWDRLQLDPTPILPPPKPPQEDPVASEVPAANNDMSMSMSTSTSMPVVSITKDDVAPISDMSMSMSMSMIMSMSMHM
jgi:hypothetical protein